MDVELRHLRSFVAVADELHFGRAAEMLHIAQPALSQQIQKLERTLGVQLLLRTSRRVTLTPAGSILHDRARALLRQTATDLDEVVSVGQGRRGRLDVGFVSSALPLGPIERIQQFCDLYPLVDVRIHEGFTARLLSQLLRGEIDIATVRDPDPQPGLTTTTLMSESFVGVVSADHPRARQQVITGAELAGDPFVFFPQVAGETAYTRNLRPVTEAGRHPRIVQEASTWLTVLHLVGAGLGVTIAPLSATHAAPPTVRVLPLVGTEASSEICVATRTGDNRAVVRSFLAMPARTAPVGGSDASITPC